MSAVVPLQHVWGLSAQRALDGENRGAGTFPGHRSGGHPSAGGGRKGGPGGKPGTGAVVLPGRGRFRVFPQCVSGLVPPAAGRGVEP